MVHDEPWQVFANNGQPLNGQSATRDGFADDVSLVMCAAHVWIWRRGTGGIEVLLQKRATTKPTWPGYWDISVAGHINADETAVQSAVREAREEIGLVLNEHALYFIFSLRTPLDLREIDHVYMHELAEEVPFRFDDGEVEELRWVAIDEFVSWTKQPEDYGLVPQGDEYFALLMTNLHRLR